MPLARTAEPLGSGGHLAAPGTHRPAAVASGGSRSRPGSEPTLPPPRSAPRRHRDAPPLPQQRRSAALRGVRGEGAGRARGSGKMASTAAGKQRIPKVAKVRGKRRPVRAAGWGGRSRRPGEASGSRHGRAAILKHGVSRVRLVRPAHPPASGGCASPHVPGRICLATG